MTAIASTANTVKTFLGNPGHPIFHFCCSLVNLKPHPIFLFKNSRRRNGIVFCVSRRGWIYGHDIRHMASLQKKFHPQKFGGVWLSTLRNPLSGKGLVILFVYSCLRCCHTAPFADAVDWFAVNVWLAIYHDDTCLLFRRQYCMVEIRNSVERTARFLVGVTRQRGNC